MCYTIHLSHWTGVDAICFFLIFFTTIDLSSCWKLVQILSSILFTDLSCWGWIRQSAVFVRMALAMRASHLLILIMGSRLSLSLFSWSLARPTGYESSFTAAAIFPLFQMPARHSCLMIAIYWSLGPVWLRGPVRGHSTRPVFLCMLYKRCSVRRVLWFS